MRIKKNIGFLLVILITPVYAIEIEEVREIKSRDISITRHIYGTGHLADISNNRITYLHQDKILSTRLETNSGGEKIKQFKSLPFGQQTINEGNR